MNLTTNYLGFTLPHPLIPGASPLTFNLDSVQALLDAGAPMLIMRSLFEEDIRIAHERKTNPNTPIPDYLSPTLTADPEDYLTRIEQIKNITNVPVVASINGSTPGGWIKYATQAQNAGADAIELNIYRITTEHDLTSSDIQFEDIQIVSELSRKLSIPLAVKITPFYTSLPAFVQALDEAGANAIVLFNRFFQPDIDIETRTLSYRLSPSTSDELNIRLRWLAILSPQTRSPLAATGGLHSHTDIIKAIMAGASVCQLVSTLMINQPTYLASLLEQLSLWLEAHNISSLSEIRGCMNFNNIDEPRAYERGNYLQVLKNAAAKTSPPC
ncbi:dihydroorotate dehydrogenase-like protein [Poriferisphaera sp. WC338]|uniref:dihydroorotate dehydrogenase-like protein n=1 Tax=Poriferisphaera sp. WC338 TaxID=3425129 RepID=UPI003D8132ED